MTGIAKISKYDGSFKFLNKLNRMLGELYVRVRDAGIFPGLGTTHTTAAYGDHLHSGVYSVVDHLHTVYTEIYICPYNIAPLVPITIPGSRSYRVGSNKLLVFINGVLQQAGTSNDYREVGNTGDVATTVMFNYNLAQDSKITFIIL